MAEDDGTMDRLGAAMDAEVRSEQQAYEAMALAAEWRARSLVDVARELVVRGDVVEVALPGMHLSGTVVHAAADHLVLRSARGPADVVLAAMSWLRVVRRMRDGGLLPGRGAASLRARMTEHEVAGVTLEVLLRDGDRVVGTVDAAAVDHLLLATRRGQTVIPWPAVAAAWAV